MCKWLQRLVSRVTALIEQGNNALPLLHTVHCAEFEEKTPSETTKPSFLSQVQTPFPPLAPIHQP
jgi:hypothetical protein